MFPQGGVRSHLAGEGLPGVGPWRKNSVSSRLQAVGRTRQAQSAHLEEHAGRASSSSRTGRRYGVRTQRDAHHGAEPGEGTAGVLRQLGAGWVGAVGLGSKSAEAESEHGLQGMPSSALSQCFHRTFAGSTCLISVRGSPWVIRNLEPLGDGSN